jgi:hypothetical protein
MHILVGKTMGGEVIWRAELRLEDNIKNES